jgi:hypothetical protein
MFFKGWKLCGTEQRRFDIHTFAVLKCRPQGADEKTAHSFKNVTKQQCQPEIPPVKVCKGKAIPVKTCSGPVSSRRLTLPDLLAIGT